MRRPFLFALSLSFLGCAASPSPSRGRGAPPAAAATVAPSVASTASDAGTVVPDEAERAALFADLVAAVRKYHHFSPHTAKNLGRRFDDELPALEHAFRAARDEPSLREALFFFGNALHDWHLHYDVERAAGRGDRLVLGLDVDARRDGDRWRYVVVGAGEAAKAAGARVGDVVESAAGVAGDELATAHALWSNANQWRGVAAGVAAWSTERNSNTTATRAGDVETWVLRHRDGARVTAKLAWSSAPWPGDEETHADGDASPDYAPKHCSLDLPDRAYPASYRLTAHGRFYCLYTSREPPYDGYPIVRHFSFLYSPVLDVTVAPRYLLPSAGWDVTSDFTSLRFALRSGPSPKGVLLDLRDNVGGNEPEWFLDAYAPAPYIDTFVTVKTLADFDDAAFRARVVNFDDGFYAWYRRAAAGLPAGSDVRRPFQCASARCDGDNRWVPSHRVTAAPVALLVGPQCGSSCAHVAQIFDENDFGPLVGTPTGSSYTDLRLAYPVKLASGRELGTLGLALSVETSGKTGEPLEGAEVHVDRSVEPSLDGAERIDVVLVDAAIRALREKATVQRKPGP